MSKTKTGKSQVSRRTLAKGAAWSVPVIATAAAAPAASASVVPGSATATLNYTCSIAASDGGTPLYTDLAWTAVITATVPTSVAPGDAIPQPTITATVTTDAASGNNLRATNTKHISGTSNAPYEVAGSVVNPGTRAGNLTIPSTTVPAAGGVTTTATGLGLAETAGSSTGDITVTVGGFTAVLNTDGFIPTLYATCVLASPSGLLMPPTQVK